MCLFKSNFFIGGAHDRIIAPEQHKSLSKKCRSVGNIVFELIDPRFEPGLPAPETNALPLDQLACSVSSCVLYPKLLVNGTATIHSFN